MPSVSATPSPFGDRSGESSHRNDSVRSITKAAVTIRVRPSSARAPTVSEYRPSGRSIGGQANEILRADWRWFVKIVVTATPLASRTVAVTEARAVRTYDTPSSSA